jgi:hypothetical protein
LAAIDDLALRRRQTSNDLPDDLQPMHIVDRNVIDDA